MRRRLTKKSIRESFDNLPSGVCYFNDQGVLVLCNRVMHELVFYLTGKRLQVIEDIEKVLNGKSLLVIYEDSVWSFTRRRIQGDEVYGGGRIEAREKTRWSNRTYIEYVATDITELHKRKKELEKSTAEHEKMVVRMGQIVKNVEAITREEEMITMKMHIHGKVGWFLQYLRQYHGKGCPQEEKSEIIEHLNDMINTLQGEVGNNDVIDSFEELVRVAKTLGVEVRVDGRIPEHEETKKLFVQVLRECITNTIRHAEGRTVFVEIQENEKSITSIMTNDGIQPEEPVSEGGGLSSLRHKIESFGGSMRTEIYPKFALIVIIPRKGEVK